MIAYVYLFVCLDSYFCIDIDCQINNTVQIARQESPMTYFL